MPEANQMLKMNAKPQRNSTIEFLRIIAMVLIVFGHQVDPTVLNPYQYEGIGGVLHYTGVAPTRNFGLFLLQFVGPLGLIGDVIFIACSSYFLVDSDRVSIKKVFFLWATDLIVMCSSLAVKAIFGDPISTQLILESVFPTLYRVNWFILYYTGFYILHPFFNYIIRKLDKKGLAILTAILVFQCNIISFYIGRKPGDIGIEFMCFISIYFVIAFYKKYGGKVWASKKFNVILLVSSIALYIATRVAVNFIGFNNEYVADPNRIYGYVHIENPFNVAMAVAMVNLASRKVRYSKVVNYISGMSLLLYLMHKNVNVFFHYDIYYFNYFLDTYGADSFVWYVFTKSLIVLGLGMLLSIIYRHTVYYGVMWLGGKTETALRSAFDKVKAKWESRKRPVAEATAAETEGSEPSDEQ